MSNFFLTQSFYFPILKLISAHNIKPSETTLQNQSVRNQNHNKPPYNIEAFEIEQAIEQEASTHTSTMSNVSEIVTVIKEYFHIHWVMATQQTRDYVAALPRIPGTMPLFTLPRLTNPHSPTNNNDSTTMEAPTAIARTPEETEAAVDKIIKFTVAHCGPRVFAAFHRLQVANPRLAEEEKEPSKALSVQSLILDEDQLIRAYKRAYKPNNDPYWALKSGTNNFMDHLDIAELVKDLNAADEARTCATIQEVVSSLGQDAIDAFARLRANGRYDYVVVPESSPVAGEASRVWEIIERNFRELA